MQNNVQAEELARKQQERFQTSVNALAIVALAGELYANEDRRRLLNELSVLVAAHKASIDQKRPNEEIREVGMARWKFEKEHPLIVRLHSNIEDLSRAIWP